MILYCCSVGLCFCSFLSFNTLFKTQSGGKLNFTFRSTFLPILHLNSLRVFLHRFQCSIRFHVLKYSLHSLVSCIFFERFSPLLRMDPSFLCAFLMVSSQVVRTPTNLTENVPLKRQKRSFFVYFTRKCFF